MQVNWAVIKKLVDHEFEMSSQLYKSSLGESTVLCIKALVRSTYIETKFRGDVIVVACNGRLNCPPEHPAFVRFLCKMR